MSSLVDRILLNNPVTVTNKFLTWPFLVPDHEILMHQSLILLYLHCDAVLPVRALKRILRYREMKMYIVIIIDSSSPGQLRHVRG